MKKLMLINASHEEESRVAIVEDDFLQELDIESTVRRRRPVASNRHFRPTRGLNGQRQPPRHRDVDYNPQQQKEQDDPELFHAGSALRIAWPHSGQAWWSVPCRS